MIFMADMSRTTRVRKWIKENGAATFDFDNKYAVLSDGLLLAIEKELKEYPAIALRSKSLNGEQIDFRNQDIILTDGALFSIEKEIKRLNKVKEVKSTSLRGIYQIQLTKQKYKTECYKCRIWFRELCSTIAYFQSMESLLNSLGYDTGRDMRKAAGEEIKKLKK